MKSESLAYWYFRLNGFLTSSNYYLHPEVGREGSRTEIDILGVRFPYKDERIKTSENSFESMPDEAIFKDKDKPYIIIAEAKKGICDLNKAWINREKKNIHDFLRVVGAFKGEEIECIANELYENGFFDNSSYCVSLFCVGESEKPKLKKKYPKIPQITWCEVLEFIYNRFERYEYLKPDHSHWDCDGKQLWACFKRNKGYKCNFINEIISCLE